MLNAPLAVSSRGGFLFFAREHIQTYVTGQFRGMTKVDVAEGNARRDGARKAPVSKKPF